MAPAAKPVDVGAQRLARPAAVMALGTALSRITGLGRILAMAFALGVTESRLADSYNLANTLPNVLYELVIGGVLSSVFIPVLVEELRTKDPEEAWRSVSALVSVTAAVALAVTAITVVAAPVIVDLLTARAPAPERGDQREVSTLLLRLFAPQVALYGLIAVAEGVLNAHGRFGAPMFAPVVNNLVVIATFGAFAMVTMGTPTARGVADDPVLVLLLGLGTTGGVAVMLIALWPLVRRLPGRVRLRLDLRHPVVRKVARLSTWTLVYVGTNALGVGVSFYLAGTVQGGLTAYTIAFAFFQLPVGIAAISVVTALVPKLSAHHVDGRRDAFREQMARGLEALALLMLPATAAVLVLAGPLVELLLEHGVVAARSSALVASVLRAFAVGLLPFAAFQLLMRAFYARQDAKTPALVNVLENAVTIALGIALFGALAVEGLALAHSIGYVAGCVAAVVALRPSLGMPFDTRLECGKALVCSIALAGAAATGVALGAATISAGDGRALAQLALGGGLGAVAFLGLARATRLRGLRQIVDGLRLARVVGARR